MADKKKEIDEGPTSEQLEKQLAEIRARTVKLKKLNEGEMDEINMLKA